MAKSVNGEEPKPRPVRWIGSSKDDLSAFPDDVKRRVGRALWDAQVGLKAPFAKPLKGFGSADVLEVVDDFDGDTYRAVYSVRFEKAVYVYEKQAWEYRVINRRIADEGTLPEADLNALGSEGWELVGVVPLPANVQFFFKRVKP